jgi:hypothetical protein
MAYDLKFDHWRRSPAIAPPCSASGRFAVVLQCGGDVWTSNLAFVSGAFSNCATGFYTATVYDLGGGHYRWVISGVLTVTAGCPGCAGETITWVIETLP